MKREILEHLKEWKEAPEYAVCAAGSLLGVALHDGVSFPVGKVDELHLYPMNFTEFLTALGEDKLARDRSNYPYLINMKEILEST